MEEKGLFRRLAVFLEKAVRNGEWEQMPTWDAGETKSVAKKKMETGEGRLFGKKEEGESEEVFFVTKEPSLSLKEEKIETERSIFSDQSILQQREDRALFHSSFLGIQEKDSTSERIVYPSAERENQDYNILQREEMRTPETTFFSLEEVSERTEKQPDFLTDIDTTDIWMKRIYMLLEKQQGADGGQAVSVQIGGRGEGADVDEIMEALTRRLWERRQMSRQKIYGR